MNDQPQTPGPQQRTPPWKRWTPRRAINTIPHYRHRWYHLYWLPQYKRDKKRETDDWKRWLHDCEQKLTATKEQQ